MPKNALSAKNLLPECLSCVMFALELDIRISAISYLADSSS